MRLRLLLFALGGALIAATTLAGPAAATYPSGFITLIVPNPPGGSADILARRFAEYVKKDLGVDIVIENRDGAGGNIAMQAAAEAAPDGQTIVVATAAQLAINPLIYKEVPYDPIGDYEPVALLAASPYLLAAPPEAAFKTIPELIAYAKANPGKLSIASGGAIPQLNGQLLKSMGGIDIVDIPYSGGAFPKSYPDLRAGRVSMIFLTPSSGGPYIADGRLNALGVTTDQRLATLPDIPTIGESLPGFVSSNWWAILAPKGTPKEAVDRLNASFMKALAEPELQKALTADSIQILGGTPEQLGDYITSEIERWRPIVKESGIQIN